MSSGQVTLNLVLGALGCFSSRELHAPQLHVWNMFGRLGPVDAKRRCQGVNELQDAIVRTFRKSYRAISARPTRSEHLPPDLIRT